MTSSRFSKNSLNRSLYNFLFIDSQTQVNNQELISVSQLYFFFQNTPFPLLMSDANNSDNIVPDRSKPTKPPTKPKPKKQQPLITQPPSSSTDPAASNIEFIFSQARDVGLLNPYHLDGDPTMYTPQNLSKRESIKKDPDIQKQLELFADLYKFTDGVVSFEEYRKVHSKLAEILRPKMDKEELEEIVKEDYKYDCGNLEGEKKNQLTRERLKEQIFEMVDIWTAGVDRLQYLAFLRLLKVKLGRVMKNK